MSGEVVRAHGGARDHLSRTSPVALLYLLVESVRELLGPLGVLGDHVVIRRADGICVLGRTCGGGRCGWLAPIGSRWAP